MNSCRCEVIPLFTNFRKSGLKGGNRSRWQREKGKQQNGKRRKERGIEARRLINDFEIVSESQPQTSTREENLFSSRFFHVEKLRR
jgi:galactose-1-phosphate uridylyltransferase